MIAKASDTVSLSKLGLITKLSKYTNIKNFEFTILKHYILLCHIMSLARNNRPNVYIYNYIHILIYICINININKCK